MLKLYTENRYGSGDSPIIKNEFDYLLFRQDWGGNEAIYFNKEEVNSIVEGYNLGEILVHNQYSILYCKSEELITLTKDYFPCYSILLSNKLE